MTRIKNIILEQLNQGTTVPSLAKATAFGIVIGTFPVLGTTTLLCFLAGYAFRLNQPILQIINYVMYPAQLLLLPVFVSVGEWLVGASHVSFKPSDLMAEFAADKSLFFKHFGMAAVHALISWAIIAPLIGFAVYAIVSRVYVRLALKRKSSGG